MDYPQDSRREMAGTRYSTQKCFKEEGSQNAWELSPGVLFHVQGSECLVRWAQLVFIGTEISRSLVGTRTAALP